MRRPSARLFPNSATFKRRTWSNVRGERVASETTVTRACNLQPGPTQRVHEQGAEGARSDYLAFFPAPDPGVNAGDVMTITIPGGAVTLTITGTANDDVGRGVMYTVNGTELT